MGPSGELLKWLLECAEAPTRENLHITNAAMCMPASVEIWEGEEPVTYTKQDTLVASTGTHCRPRLLAELSKARPKVILAVGGYALESLTGRSGVLKHHGAVIDSSHLGWPCWTLPMLHPAALLRNAKNTDAVVMVLQKAFRIAREGKPRFRGDRVIITPRMPGGAPKAYALLCFWVDTLLAEGADLSIDVETTNEDARNAAMTVFGFGSVPRANGVAVSLLAWNRALGVFAPVWQPPFDELVQQQISRIVSCSLRKWYWNYRFDVTVLERDYPETCGPHADGMHLHWLMQPELEHNLAFAVQSMVDTPPWKVDFWDKQNAGEATDDDLLEYNADDVINTARVVEPLKHAAAVRGNDHLVEHQMRVAELARRAEAYGVPVCKDTWRTLHDEYSTKQQACLKVMRDAIRADENGAAGLTRSVHRQRCADARKRAEKTGKYNAPQHNQLWADDFAPRSPYHARWYLYEFARIRPERFTAGGEEGTNKKASTSYKGVLGYLKNPLVKAYVDFSEWDAKLVYLRSVERHCITDDDGWWRLYVSWSTTGMKGTRWTSRVVNMQNWEKKLRKVLRAKPGRCWVGADACLAAGTLVETPAGRRRIEDIKAGDKVYTLRGRRVAWSTVERAALTGVQPVKAVRFSNGETVLATAEHRWPTRNDNGEVVVLRTDELRVGARMVPFKRRPYLQRGRTNALYAYSAFEYTVEHVAVAEAMLGLRPEGYHVHHKDGDPRNNAWRNLEYKPATEHWSDHGKEQYQQQDHTKRLSRLRVALKGRRSYDREGNPNWRGGKVVAQCLLCNTEMPPRFPSAVKKYCSRGCYHKARRRGLNCTVVSVAPAGVLPTYNLTVAGDHNFALAAGVFTLNSQIEYRIAAALAGLKPLVELFNAPAFDEHAEEWKKYDGRYDAHSLVAEMVFGDIYKNGSIEDKGKWRTLVKRVVYAMFYGAHPEKILNSLREDRRLPSALRATLSLQRVDKIWRTFKTMFPEWDAWAQKEMDLAEQRGYQTFPPFERRRWWRQRDIEENKIRNTPIQLAAGDVCNLIFCNIQDRLDAEGLDAQMTIHGHDAIYLDTAEDVAERVCEIVNEEFHYMFPGPGGAVHIYGQAGVGASVGDVG